MADEISLHLNLTPQEAIKRLREHPKMLDVPSFLFTITEVWVSPRSKTIVGEFRENGFVMRGKHYYSNGLQPFLEGTIEPAEGGSMMVARFRRLQSMVWLVWGIILYQGVAGLMMIQNGEETEILLAGRILMGSAVFVLFLSFLMRWLGDKDRPYIRDFIHTLYADVRRS